MNILIEVSLGLVIGVCATLLFSEIRGLRRDLKDAKLQIASLEAVIVKMNEAQQKRVNYKALEAIEDAAATLAAARVRAEMELKALQGELDTATIYLSRAHTPK